MILTTIPSFNRKAIARMVKESGLTYLQLESLTGIPHSALQRYVAGTTEKIPMDRAQRLLDVLRELGQGATDTPNDQDHLRGEDHMITLNDLLTIVDARQLRVVVPVTPRLKARITVNTRQSAELDDIVRLYGEWPVFSAEPAHEGNVMEIELTDRAEVALKGAGAKCTEASPC